mgnify:FL=1
MHIIITRTLRKAGFRATPQRIAIYQTLARTKEHPCVEIVYQKVHEEFPSLSLNTVYKTLQTFEELGLVRRLDAGEGMCRYDANPSPHIHFLCRTCGRMLDVDFDRSSTLRAIRETVENRTGHVVCDYSLILHDYCSACSHRGKNPR